MAERKVKIVAIIDAESGDYDKTLTSVQGKTTLFGNVVQGIFQGIGQAIYRHFVGGLTDAGKKMVSMIGDSIGKAADLEYALAEVATLGVKDMERMRRGVLDFSYTIGEDAVKGTKALYQAISAGVPEENVLTFIETASKGAIAGLTETSVMVNALTTVIEAYNLKWEDAARVSDLLFTTVKYGKTEMSLLAPVIGRVAAIAKQAGISLEEMFGWLAKSTLLYETTEAITGLKATIQAFLKPTSESIKVLKELDLTWQQMQKTVADEGMAKFLSQLSRDQLPRFLGSIEALGSVLSVIGSDPGAREFLKLLEEFRNSAGATETAFGQMVEAFKHQWNLLKQRVETAKTEVGAPLMEIGKEIVKSINEWLDMPGPDGRTPIQAFGQWADRARKRVIDDLDLVRKGDKTWGEIISGWLDDSWPAIEKALDDFGRSKFWIEFKAQTEQGWEEVKPSLIVFFEEVGRALMNAMVDAAKEVARASAVGLANVFADTFQNAVAGPFGIESLLETIFGEGPPGIPSLTVPGGRVGPIPTPSPTPTPTLTRTPAEAARDVATGLEEAVKAGENYIKIGGEIVTLKSMGLDDAAESADKLAKELDDLGGVQEGYYKIVVNGVETVGKLDEAISEIDTESLQNSIEETLAETTKTVKDYTGSVFWTDFKASLTSGWEKQSPGILAFAENVGKDIVQLIAGGASASQGILTAAIAAIVRSALGTASAITNNITGEVEGEGRGGQLIPWSLEGESLGQQSSTVIHAPIYVEGAGDPDLVAEKVARKILDLQRFGRFSLAPGLAK